MNTAVAFIIFNRPQPTQRVFAEIAKAKPPKLFVIADGPRADRPDDASKCAATAAIIDQIDWDCEIFKNYSDVNLGMAGRTVSGITWVFEHVEEAIILEDDCLPHPTFFRFCEELLEKYRQDERVMQISGNNFQFGRKCTPFSYFFGYQNNPCWGWATWRRAWRHFDFTVRLWPLLRNTSWLSDLVRDPRAAEDWKQMFDGAYAFSGVRPIGSGNDIPQDLSDPEKLTRLFDSLHRRRLIRAIPNAASAWPGEFGTWDYQWSFSCWAQNGLAVLPECTLVSNIGFGPESTNTRSADGDRRAGLPTEPMVFPLRHPPVVVPDREADQRVIEAVLWFLLPKPLNFYQQLCQKWFNFLNNHPSVKSPQSFARRLGQKCFAIVRGVSKSNFFTPFSDRGRR